MFTKKASAKIIWNGYPPGPEASGWHWIEAGDGLRPMLWRGQDWPDAVDCETWQDGYAMLAPGDLRHARYLGPIPLPPEAARLFRKSLAAGK